MVKRGAATCLEGGALMRSMATRLTQQEKAEEHGDGRILPPALMMQMQITRIFDICQARIRAIHRDAPDHGHVMACRTAAVAWRDSSEPRPLRRTVAPGWPSRPAEPLRFEARRAMLSDRIHYGSRTVCKSGLQ